MAKPFFKLLLMLLVTNNSYSQESSPNIIKERIERQRLSEIERLGLIGTKSVSRGKKIITYEDYQSVVGNHIRQRIHYRPNCNETQVATTILIEQSPSGEVLAVTVKNRSGNDEWDNAVLKAAQQSSPLPIFTAEAKRAVPRIFELSATNLGPGELSIPKPCE